MHNSTPLQQAITPSKFSAFQAPTSKHTTQNEQIAQPAGDAGRCASYNCIQADAQTCATLWKQALDMVALPCDQKVHAHSRLCPILTVPNKAITQMMQKDSQCETSQAARIICHQGAGNQPKQIKATVAAMTKQIKGAACACLLYAQLDTQAQPVRMACATMTQPKAEL